MVALGTIGLCLLIALIGHLLYRALFPQTYEAWEESLFLRFFAGFLLCGWMALLLAELGLFSPILVVLLLAMGSGIVWLARRRHLRRQLRPRLRLGKKSALIAVLFLGLGTILVFPGEWVLGGQDPGAYIVTGVSIARTGGILVRDPQVASIPEQGNFLFSSYIGQQWLLPGFYLTDRESGEITPQFLHLYPSWLALFYSIGGLTSALLATPLFTLLGLLAFYFLVRNLVGRWAAPVALVFLALNPAQIWFAREPGAESLTLPLLLGGWYLFDRALHEPDRRDLAVLAGLSLGQVALAKIEFLSLPVLIYGYLLLRRSLARFEANERVFLCMYTLVLVHAALHIALISRPYVLTFSTSLGYSRFLPAWAWFLLLGLGFAGVVLLLIFRRSVGRLMRHLWTHEDRIRRGLVLLGLIAVLYGAVVWPLLAPARLYVEGEWRTNYHRLFFLRLLWYLSPLGLALSVAGLLWWIRRRLDGPSLPFFAAFALEGAIFVHSTMDYPSHFWMMRRYIPLVFPCLAIGMAAALQAIRRVSLWKTVRYGTAWLLVGLQVLFLVQAGFPIASRRELAGTIHRLEVLAEGLPQSSPVFVEQFGVALATPLRFLYGKEAFALPQPVPWRDLWLLLQQWPADGDAYLLLENPPSVFYGGVRLSRIATFVLETWGTETTLDHLPREAVLVRSVQGIYRVERQRAGPVLLEFSSPEPQWSGDQITVIFPEVSSPLDLRLEVAGFRPETVPPARVQFFWNGRSIADFPLPRTPEPQEIVLTLPPEEGEAYLEIRFTTWNPRAAGFGDDPRDLGVLLKSLVVKESDRPENRQTLRRLIARDIIE